MMPAGKSYHLFATHKKEKKQTEQLVVHVKDMLEQKGVQVKKPKPLPQIDLILIRFGGILRL
jgi:hypothetical protein